MTESPQAGDILDFWFSDENRSRWFAASPDFDAEVKDRFAGALLTATAAPFDGAWDTPRGALARVLLLDQFPRNIFRGAPQAFATDTAALAIAEGAVARGFDNQLEQDRRVFLYMPYMHAENRDAQDRGMDLFERLGRAEQVDYMRRHREIIARFGRFPHRNAILGRASTPEELAFLETPGSSF